MSAPSRARRDSLDRLLAGVVSPEPLTEVGPDARITESRIVFPVDDRVVRISPAGGIVRSTADGIDRAKAVAIALAARDAVPKALPERSAVRLRVPVVELGGRAVRRGARPAAPATTA